MEFIGLHLSGTSFVNPGTPLREALTVAAAKRAIEITQLGDEYTPIADVVTAKAIVNGIVGLLASGGSTNLTLHLVAIARAAGIIINWDDFDKLSAIVPLLARVYPNGNADVNHFQAAGGVQYMVRELLDNGLLFEDVKTVMGTGMRGYTQEPYLDEGALKWREGVSSSGDDKVLSTYAEPFAASGGLKVVRGNLGRGIVKTSAVKIEHHVVEAPAKVFTSQHEVVASYKRGELNQDVVVVLRMQGPRANGMPELHKLTPTLSVLQNRGFRVALVTDGRMSGASGKVPSAIQVWPEALDGGLLAKVKDGDVIRLNATAGTLDLAVAKEELDARPLDLTQTEDGENGCGRELFSQFRQYAGSSETGGGPALFDKTEETEAVVGEVAHA